MYVFREIILLQWLISPIYTLYLVDKLAKTFEESLALRDFPPGSIMTRRERPFLDKLAKTFEQFYDSPPGSTMREHPALLGRTDNKMTDREKVGFHIYIYVGELTM